MDSPITSEAGALAELSLRELGAAVSGIHKIQRAVSDRVFRYVGFGVGPAARPTKIIYDAITDGVYEAISSSATTAAPVIGMAIDAQMSTASHVSDDVRGAGAIAAVQGLIGDRLHHEGSVLATTMSVRVNHRPVELDRESILAAFPHATGNIVVFVHGLMETETAWAFGGRPTYSQRLTADARLTGVTVRYNTGLHISENGRLLAELLEQLTGAWPVPIKTVSLVGHSMGGLVIRSACAVPGISWADSVRNVVMLGSPHTGAPLEKLVHFGSAALHSLPETRPLAGLLRRRSTGIRDLRFGSLDERDWQERDPDALRAETQIDVPLLDGVSYYCVSAVLTRSAANPIGWVIGDGLVQVPSAHGRSRSRRINFRPENRLHINKAHHFTLLNNDAVYEQLRAWLSARPVVDSVRC